MDLGVPRSSRGGGTIPPKHRHETRAWPQWVGCLRLVAGPAGRAAAAGFQGPEEALAGACGSPAPILNKVLIFKLKLAQELPV